MLDVIKGLWFSIDAGRDVEEIETEAVARMLVQMDAMRSTYAARQYIFTKTDKKTRFLSWDDFNVLFATCIFKHAIVAKSNSLSEQVNTEESEIV